MSATDVQSRILPWLQRWSISDVAAARPWLDSMYTGRYAPDEFLVHNGQRSDILYLLESGLVRLFYTTPDGKERNKAFYTTGQVAGPVSAAMTDTTAPFSIQALEPVEAICFRYPDLLRCARSSLEMAELCRQVLAEAFIRNEQREAMLLTCNAEQRYQWLLQHEAFLLDRVTQFHIASYLGIDAVSLSRLKRKFRE